MTAGRVRRAPWWVWPVTVFVTTRALGAVMILIAARHQVAVDTTIGAWHTAKPAAPGYLDVATNWDGQYYGAIARFGYPSSLPVAGGHVLASEWAFAPLYPFVVRGVMWLSGLHFAAAGTFVTLATSLAAVVLLHRLLARETGLFTARATTLLLCTSMASPALQITYTEGPALLLVVMSLWLLRQERYGWTAACLLALALTRHVVAPFVVVLAVHAVDRRRRTGRWSRASLALVGTGMASAALWPAVAALVTERLTAFTDTQRAWRLHPGSTGPFGLFSVGWEVGGAWGLLLVALAAAGLLWLALRHRGPAWSPEVRAWAASYPLYLVAVAPVAVSMFRLMLLAFPLAWVVGEERPTPRRHWAALTVLAVAGLLLQWFWVRYMLVVGPPGDHLAIP